MSTTTAPGRVTPGLLRTLTQAVGGTKAGDAKTFVWSDERGKQITLHLDYGKRFTYVGIDRLDLERPRSASATATLARIFEEHGAEHYRVGRSYSAGSVPTPVAPLVILHLVAVETGATFTAGGRS